MMSPTYRDRVQAVADVAASMLPPEWQELRIDATFVSSVRTRLETRIVPGPDQPAQQLHIPGAIIDDLVDALAAIRQELVTAGNPPCKVLRFQLVRDGKSSVDVEY